MYVCVCNRVTDTEIRHQAESGCRSLTELGDRLGVGMRCGRCRDYAADLLRQQGRSAWVGTDPAAA
jgi:bacterioferritin-associated ferredoxin